MATGTEEFPAPAVTESTIAPAVRQHADTCPNCHAPVRGEWCFECGQRQRSIHREFYALFSEAFDDVFSPDSRTFRTLLAILFRPGFLTREYFAGRRARYIPPLKLYLVSSVLFFFVLSLEGMVNDTPIVMVGKDKATVIVAPADSSTAKPGPPEAGQEPQSWRETLPNEVDKLNFDWLPATANQVMHNRLKAQTEKAIRLADEDPDELVNALLDAAPPVLFLLVPLFALLLKLSYLGSGRFYAEHLVLAAHNHSFLFLVLIVDLALLGLEAWIPTLAAWSRGIIRVWIPVYMYLSLKNTFNQGYWITLFKFLILGVGYWILFIMGLCLAVLLGLLAL